MNPDGTDRVRLTAGPADDRMPDYSPKGAKIAFTRDRDVYTMNTDGSALTRLTTEGGEQPSWSPDGTKLAFSSYRDGGYSEIYVMDADGSNETNITNHPAHDSNPDWQPATSDTTPPQTTIDSGPSGYKNLTHYRFTFSSSEGNSNNGFQCSLDTTPFYRSFYRCDSPFSYYDLPDGPHTFRVRAVDSFFNVDPTPASRSWFVDTVKPSGTVLINDGRTSTASRTVTLKLSATDPTPASGVASMRFRNENTTTWSAWQSYATSKSWTLASGAGTKTVYAQYRDRAKNISDATSDAITYRP
jgi:dipeptidyl aminopeptidase/acylaminoacyl peptidase